MEDIYQDLDTVDLWVGGLAEDHEDGSELGETFRTYVASILMTYKIKFIFISAKIMSLLFLGKAADR